MPIYFKAQFFKRSERFPLRLAWWNQKIRVKIELPRSGNRWIEHPQRSCGRISRIGKPRQVSKFALRVQLLERLPVEHHFAAHFERTMRAQRNRFDGARVFR